MRAAGPGAECPHPPAYGMDYTQHRRPYDAYFSLLLMRRLT